MKTKQGHSTSLKVPIGDKVAINTTIGMIVIKVAKLSLDLDDDDVVYPEVFYCAPFALKFKEATRFMLNLDGGSPSLGKVMYHENTTGLEDTINA
eukprot:3896206-Ditylum_brightwellii.AAC.2